jgi:hypothetical protein
MYNISIKLKRYFLKIIIALLFVLSLHSKDYTKNIETVKFINKMVKEYNFKKSYLLKYLLDNQAQFI